MARDGSKGGSVSSMCRATANEAAWDGRKRGGRRELAGGVNLFELVPRFSGSPCRTEPETNASFAKQGTGDDLSPHDLRTNLGFSCSRSHDVSHLRAPPAQKHTASLHQWPFRPNLGTKLIMVSLKHNQSTHVAVSVYHFTLM